MAKVKWIEGNKIQVTPPKKPKKITGTRFAAIQGLNKWTTPFNTWCAITKTYEEPFEDTIYTIAGKTIEPKQYEFMKDKYFFRKTVSPEDVYGKDYFSKTYGDFFPEHKVYGGMWDYLFVDKDGKPEAVMEMKTTKRAEDWKDDIPEYYALQAALYGCLLKVDDIIMVCTILEDEDYKNPDKFVVTDKNTFTREFKISERYPNIKEIIENTDQWWKDHVVTGISPEYDETADADILKELRKNNYNPTSDIEAVLLEAEELSDAISKHNLLIKDKEDRLKVLKDIIKAAAVDQFRDGDKQVSMRGNKYEFVVTKSIREDVDKALMKKNGVYEEYVKKTESYRLAPKEIKEEK